MPHILVVDDDHAIRMLLTRVLEMSGHAVTASQNGQDALEILESITPDLVLTDLEMPEVGGRELLDSIRLLHPGVSVVGMSGAAYRHPGVPELFDAFMTKPFQLDTLVATVEDSLSLAASG